MQPVQRPQVSPEVEEYTKANEWVNNPILREHGAKLIDAFGMATRPHREQLDFAERELRKLYPAAFQPAAPVAAAQAQAKPVVQRVDGGGLGGGAKVSAFTALPSEAKSAFKRFVDQGIFQDTDADRKRYADDYNS
jgi:hypothetical protein